MFRPTIRARALVAALSVFLLALSASYWSTAAQRAVEQPGRAQGDKVKELQKERLEILRQILKEATASFQAGTGSVDEVLEASRRALQPELDLCDTDKDRNVVLEKLVAAAKDLEQHAAQLAKTGQAPARVAVKVTVERLQSEIAQEQAK